MDAIDGKQARRTGMAGPLGEMFDHGIGESEGLGWTGGLGRVLGLLCRGFVPSEEGGGNRVAP